MVSYAYKPNELENTVFICVFMVVSGGGERSWELKAEENGREGKRGSGMKQRVGTKNNTEEEGNWDRKQ